MRLNGLPGLVLMLTGIASYLLFDGIGTRGGLVAVGVIGAVYGLMTFRHPSHWRASHRNRWFHVQAQGLSRFLSWRQRETTRPLRQSMRLEKLLSKAHYLATTCHDTYGARNRCLEIIRQTRKEDPLFLQACDLYIQTATVGLQRHPVERPSMVGARVFHPMDVKPAPAGANVIPFPLNACRS